MFAFPWMRGLLVAVVAVSMTLFSPAESHAIFHWFRRNCTTSQTAFMVAPTYSNMACGPQPVVASYVPQTCYRVQQITVPVTTFRPVVTFRPVTTVQQTTSLDPCTGCPVVCQRPVTVMQPVTTMQPVQSCMRQTQMVPYTTYQIVYSAPAVVAAPATVVQSVQPACGSCAPAVYNAPAATTYSPSTTTTVPSTGMPGYSQPSLSPSTAVPGYSQSPIQSAPAYGSSTPTYPYGSQAYPTYPSQPQGTSPPAAGSQTFESQRPAVTQPPAGSNGAPSTNGTNGTNGTTAPMTPIPDAQTSGAGSTSNSSMPRLIDPDNHTTSLPDDGWVKYVAHPHNAPAAVMAVATQPAAAAPRVGAPPTRATIDDDGWQASSR